MTRDEAWEVVAGSIEVVNGFKAVPIATVQTLLTAGQIEALAADSVRNMGPIRKPKDARHPPYIYPWNVVDYLCKEAAESK